jgi:SET domain-containing protein
VNEIPLSWRSSKTEVRRSPIHGKGLFATAGFAKGETVMIKGGHIVSRDFLEREVTPKLGPVEIQIGDDLFITPVTAQEREGSMLYSNHSCDPNLGLRGNVIFVARREIETGEELTHDWCMTDDDTYAIECTCGSANCRRVLTGKDWQRPELQARYRGYFATYLADKFSQNGG